jgi:hypothetical protein
LFRDDVLVLCGALRQLEAVGEQCGFDGVDRRAHGGMLKAAMSIKQEIEAHDTLGRIFNGFETNMKTPLRVVSVPQL